MNNLTNKTIVKSANQLTYLSSSIAYSAAQHSLCLRLAKDVNHVQIDENFKSVLSLSPLFIENNISQLQLWIELLECHSDSPLAKKVAHRENYRALPKSSSGMFRAVILRYADGFSDLILVAHRAFGEIAGLWGFSESILGDGDTIHAGYPECQDKEINFLLEPLQLSDFSPRPDWGVNKCNANSIDGYCMTNLTNPGHEEADCWLAAIGTVLARFFHSESPVIAVNNISRPDPSRAVTDGFQLIPLPVTESTTSTNLQSHIRDCLGSEPLWHTDALTETLKGCENGGEVSIAVIFSDSKSISIPHLVSYSYQPCLSNPYPITLSFESGQDNEPLLRCIYDIDSFPYEMIQCFMDCIHHSYQSIREDQGLLLAQFPLISKSQQQGIIAKGKQAELESFIPKRLEQLFLEQAAKTPNAIALSYEEQELSYAELEKKAHVFAINLIARGVNPGDRVGICLDRSFDLIVTMLGILKTGAIYIPMDSAYPEERLAYTCDNSEISIVITELESFPTASDRQLVQPQELAVTPSEPEIRLPVFETEHASDPAYVIYTSGSTGKPKGVVVPHCNVMSLLEATRKEFKLIKEDIWTFFHSAAFDFSVWEIWGALLTGAHLVIVPYWVSRSPDEFVEWVRKRQVSVLNQTPSAFSQFMDAERSGSVLPKLRLVIFGGEPLDTKILQPWLDRYSEDQCRLVNMFGITETTVHVTAQTVGHAEIITGSRTVGPALPGWYLYVLDSKQNLLPYGVSGEIYVGGAGVAMQYLNRPDLTIERFIPDPFRGGVMYRSGDKGRLLKNGNLEHLGRLDNQIKLRGFRIELDEIRKVLLDILGVQAAAVVLNQLDENDPASARLDSYIVLDQVSVDDVKIKAGKLLPAYMMPSTFTELNVMPLTANGKLNTKQLPAPNTLPINLATQSKVLSRNGCTELKVDVQPESQSEEKKLGTQMRDIWSDVLGCDVKEEDNFFALGGNSLYAVRIASKMRSAGLPPLPMRELYIHQSIDKLVPIMSASGGA